MASTSTSMRADEVNQMKRRELLTSKKAPWNRRFWHPNCQTSVEFDTLDSSFVRGTIRIIALRASRALSAALV
jgi:hypothetical protein